MKRSRANSEDKEKETSSTGRTSTSEEEYNEPRSRQRPRTSRTGATDDSGGLNASFAVEDSARGGQPPSLFASSSSGTNDASLMANSLLFRQAQLAQPMPWASTAESAMGGARVNPSLDNRPYFFNAGNFFNRDARQPMMGLPGQQRQDGIGPHPPGTAAAPDEPRMLVGYEANGMPILVPTSIALSLMSFNMPGGASGVPPGTPGVAQPVAQHLLYPQLLARTQHQQQHRQLMGSREPPGNADNREETSAGGPSSSASGRSSADNNLDLQPNPWRPGANTGITGASAQGFAASARQPDLSQLGADASLFARGADAGGWPSLAGLMGADAQLPGSMPPSQQGSGVERGAARHSFSVGQQEQPATRGPRSFVLYMSCDDESLSDYQCLVRKQIEVFESQEEDVETNAQGRNKPLVLKQVGIRCRHCASLPPRHRSRGSTYYPAKLHGLYQAAQNMASNHLCGYCQTIPESLKQQLITLRDRKSPAGGGKQYWADGVKVLGVYEHEDGLRFSDD